VNAVEALADVGKRPRDLPIGTEDWFIR